MRRQFLLYCCLASLGLFWPAGILRAQVLLHSIPRCGTGYGGGVCAHPAGADFKIYETWVSSSSNAREIFIKEPVGGRVVSRLIGPFIDGAHDIAYDSKRKVFWLTLWGGPIVSINPETGDLITNLGSPIKHCYGIFYDREIDRLWVASAYNKKIVRINPGTGKLEAEILVKHALGDQYNCPTGLVKTGDTFLVGAAGEYAYAKGISYIVELDGRGNRTGRPAYRMPAGKYAHDIGGFSLDPAGLLWVKGGKGTAIYRFEIGYQPPVDIDLSVSSIDSGDYNGDGTSDLAIFRPGSGLWAIRSVTRAYFGVAGDIPVSGDFKGDGTTDIALFRPASGLWSVRDFGQAYFGSQGDIPVPGDYTGTGTITPAVFRPATGLWAVRSLTRLYFGSQGDIPVPYYDELGGEKKIAIFRPATGLWASLSGRTYFGSQSDQPVIGSYHPDQYDVKPAIYRPASGLWAVRGVARAYFGMPGDQPVPMNYAGSPSADIGVFRPASGLWAVRGVTRAYFGSAGDIPVTGFSINP